MNVFVVSQGQDTGGQAYRTVAAFRKYAPDWNVRSMCAGHTYIQFPFDLEWDLELARKLYAEADVVEHQNWLYGYAMYETGQRKPTVLRHHGSPLRGNAKEANREAASVGAVQLVATVDLLDDAPQATWAPGFFDLDAIGKRYPQRTRKGVIRIGHGPTVREAKGTETILAALERVNARHPEVTVDLIEKVPWIVSLSRKARCDIWIDQITLGYGGSTIEAMAQGVPVISGWAEPSDRALFERETGEPVPFLHATADDLEERIEQMVVDAVLRKTVAADGLAFAQRWHSEERGVRQMQAIYEGAPPSLGFGKLWLHGDVNKDEVVKKHTVKRRKVAA